MTYFGSLFGPLFWPLFMFHPNMHAIVGQYEGTSTKLQKRVQKVVPGGVPDLAGPPKLSKKVTFWRQNIKFDMLGVKK